MHLKKKKNIVKKFEKNKSKGRKSGSNDFGIIQFIMQYLQNSTVYNVHILRSEYSTVHQKWKWDPGPQTCM